MKYSAGDKVLLKHTGEEGVVVDFISSNMLRVEVGGVIFPVHTDDVDHPYLQWFIGKRIKEKKEQAVTPVQLPVDKARIIPRSPDGISLSFIPLFEADAPEDIVREMKIYFMNELPVRITYRYDFRINGHSHFQHSAVLQPYSHIHLHTIAYADMNDYPKFYWSAKPDATTAYQTAEGILQLKPAKLAGHIQNLLVRNEAMFSCLLLHDFIKKEKKPAPRPAIPSRPSAMPQKNSSGKLKTKAHEPVYELDLHLEQLVDGHNRIKSSEALEWQLSVLRQSLQQAVAHRQEKMIIIHGLGSGVLRDAVHQILDTIPEVYLYEHAWQGKYGFGATEVNFRYN